MIEPFVLHRCQLNLAVTGGIDAYKVKSLAVHRPIVVKKKKNYSGQIFVYTKELKMRRRGKTLNFIFDLNSFETRPSS